MIFKQIERMYEYLMKNIKFKYQEGCKNRD